MRRKIFQFATVLLAVVVMALPFGAVCRYVTVTEAQMQHEIIENHSYFNISPFVYSITESFNQMETVSFNSIFGMLPFWLYNLSFFMCAVAACAAMLLILANMFGALESKMMLVLTISLLSAAILLSFVPLLFYGVTFYSIWALMVSYLLICSLVISIQRLTGGKVYNESVEEDTTDN